MCLIYKYRSPHSQCQLLVDSLHTYSLVKHLSFTVVESVEELVIPLSIWLCECEEEIISASLTQQRIQENGISSLGTAGRCLLWSCLLLLEDAILYKRRKDKYNWGNKRKAKGSADKG